MSVTFGTPVIFDGYENGSGVYSFPSITAVSGQPIIVCSTSFQQSRIVNSITDNFSTPYAWVQVCGTTSDPDRTIEIWIGTGGAGTSGVITVNTSATGGYPMSGYAVSCLGASTNAGLAAIDVSNTSNTGNSTTMTTAAVTPSAANNGAVAFVSNGANSSINADPGAPWVATRIAYAGGATKALGAGNYPSPPASSLSTAWTQNTAVLYVSAIAVVKAKPSPLQQSLMIN